MDENCEVVSILKENGAKVTEKIIVIIHEKDDDELKETLCKILSIN